MRGTGIRWVAVAGVAALVLAGCTSKEERAGVSGNEAGAGWEAGTGTIKIGLIAPMTGTYAVLGNLQANSVRVAVERINRNGGLGGAKLEVVVRDSALDPGKAVKAANELAGNSQVGMVIGPSLSAFYNASKATYENNRKVNCQPGVGTGDFTDLEYGFRSQDRIDQGVQKLLAYLKSQRVGSIGLVHEADDTGKAIDGYLERLAPRYGVTYEGFEETRPDDQTHRPYVDGLRDAGAIFVSSNASGARTMAAAGEIGYRGQLVGTSGMQNIHFLDAAGDLADGAVFAAGNLQFAMRDRASWKPGYRNHVEAIEERYGSVVGPRSGAKMPKGTPIAADCVVAYGAAAGKARSIEPDEVADAIEKLEIPATRTPSGNAIRPADHDFYHLDDLHTYRWDKDGEGWFTTEVTPQS